MNNTNLNSQNTATQNFDEKAFALLIPIFLIALVTLAILFVPFDDVSGTDASANASTEMSETEQFTKIKNN
jgi:hypothetical protein